MKNKTSIIPILALAALLIFTSSCKRNAVEEPSPFGPSSLAVVLKMTASPNVLFAGASRDMTTITATLKRYDGMAIAGKTVYFDVRDLSGNRITLGFFEGNQSTPIKITDQNGAVSVNYYGPFAQEIIADGTFYVSATVAWAGEEFIYEYAPLYVIRDAETMSFVVTADPNTLLATDTRPTSLIKAYLNTADGIPAANREVFFWIEEIPGFFMTGGVFEGNKTLGSARTDQNGVATITYYGPTKYEIGGDGSLWIYAQPDISALISEDQDPDYLQARVGIRILKDQ